MRQAGFLASAGRMALRDNVSRMALDHALARQLGEQLAVLPGLCTDIASIETNMAMVHVAPEMMTAAEFAAGLAEHDVHVMPMGPQVLRFVTHLDVGSPQLEQLVTAAKALTEKHAGKLG